ncbi:DNA-directed RNA polymerase subunit epsilon [Leuconostocaceae bacterium ESL0723]|nr:DNA-directed RNA polymerase subunit epsilon [Lactobacillaceae bacterium L1_55_11]WEV54893.1 DNA-directed RNA polymerase subunit epsilon [Leuconostocaceae bacterium ESL0723]
MVFKVYFQEDPDRNPKREETHSMYIEATDLPDAMAKVQANTNYNVEHIEELSDKSLTYEQASPDFEITKF